ncbi:MAG: hypothetical protein IJ717_12740 [Treponema sp.]|nr:hypothetical protein [Treponema sp.]
MKISNTNIYIPQKSETCLSKNGNPLSVYRTASEAQDSADYQMRQNRIRLSPYKCDVCGMYHLSPSEFFCEKLESSCSCTDHNGKIKDSYKTLQDAKKMANIRKLAGIDLFVYECPHGNGYHLTSNKGD